MKQNVKASIHAVTTKYAIPISIPSYARTDINTSYEVTTINRDVTEE
jgi:hypothetical protein